MEMCVCKLAKVGERLVSITKNSATIHRKS